jgi:hypothetical protein
MMKKYLLILAPAFALASCTSNPSEKKSEISEPKIEASNLVLQDTAEVKQTTSENSIKDSVKVATLKPALDPKKVNGGEIALAFMEGYMRFSNSMRPGSESSEIGQIEWVQQCQLVTRSFKTIHQNIYDEAEKADPEYGLDFDPIFNAQDNPEKGFIITNVDGNYISLQGTDMPQFEVVVNVKQERGKWLVDGAGVVNIPEEKRAFVD